jgi:hypothetical protein
MTLSHLPAPLEKLANKDLESVFQIRSSWAQFLMRQRFVRLEKSITCVFSISLKVPIPPAGTTDLKEVSHHREYPT